VQKTLGVEGLSAVTRQSINPITISTNSTNGNYFAHRLSHPQIRFSITEPDLRVLLHVRSHL
jgi:hypothetical protein